jgi:hypothetical protein
LSNRTKRDVKYNRRYRTNDKGLEYLIAEETIKEIEKGEVITEEVPNRRKKGCFFKGAKKGQVWRITYVGNNIWTDIISADLIKS